MPAQPGSYICSSCLRRLPRTRRPFLLLRLNASTMASSAITPSTPPIDTTVSPLPILRYPPSQPPSHKPAKFRKSQLHRQYTSLLRSTPLMLLFQHSNVKATEWMSLRRELNKAFKKVDESQDAAVSARENTAPYSPLAPSIKIQTIQTSIFASALLVSDYFQPHEPPPPPSPSSPERDSSAQISNEPTNPASGYYTHSLSRFAHNATASRKQEHPLYPLLSGPLCVLTFPSVSLAHLAVTISMLAPNPPKFAAPSRKANPGWHEPATQAAVQKLMLLGARVEGRVMDSEGVNWVGGIEGGLEGLRSTLVAMLGGVSANVANTLESIGKSLYMTVEGRRTMLEDEAKEKAGSGQAP